MINQEYLNDLTNRKLILEDRLNRTIEVTVDRELLKKRYDELVKVNNLIIGHYSRLLVDEMENNLILMEMAGY